ncbi:MAG: PEGA domain-containing protein [Thermoanaerobaculia bacterium]
MKRLLGISFVALVMMAVLMPEEASARGRHGHHGVRGHHYSHFGIGIGFGYPSYYYGPYYGRYGYYGSYGYGPYGYRPYVYAREGESHVPPGGVDVNVKPKKNTQVWIDGSYVGLAKAFDGWPGYLWLPKGSYKMVLFSPGYQTVERDITVYPGVVIDFRLQLAPGESTPPQEIVPPKSEDQTPASFPGIRNLPRPNVADAGTASVRVRDVPGEPGRLQLAVTPADASVYLDGRFVGRGKEITEEGRGLAIEPGEHLLEVVRPGHEPETLAFNAGSGEIVELEVRLAAENG